MKKTTVLKLILSFIFLLQFFLLQGDTSNNTGELAPLNPDFLEYLENAKEGQYRFFTDEGFPMGYIPSPVDLSHVRGVVDNQVLTGYTSKYDIRSKNKVTPVRNQGQCSSCWTFGTYGSLESFLMPSEPWDFSEQHLNANHGFDNPECEGGNAKKATAYLARWDGPVRESDVPYPYSLSSPNGYSIAKHIQKVIFLPERSGKLDNDTIKYFVTNYGAVNFAYFHSGYHYNENTYSYYYNYSTRDPGSDKTKGWHSVVIVGWNDNYSKYNFNITPPGNGAFIVKNSWGTNWGQKGYFYISYYDKSMKDFVSFNNAEATNNYKRNYQYDPLGWTMSYGYGNTTAWCANIFTAVDNNTLRAVSFYTTDKDVNYTIYIYKGCQAGKPRSGTLAAQKTGSRSYPGYYTVKLGSSVSLKEGQRFSIVIKFKNSSYNYPVAVEKPVSNNSSQAAANTGESFVSHYGNSWYDIARQYSNTNVCIKAFTGGYSPGGNPKITISRNKMNFGYIIGGSTTSSQSFTVSNSGTGKLKWTISDSANWLDYTPASGTNSGVVTVSVKASGLSAGSYTGYLYVIDPYASNSPRKVTVKLTVKKSWQAQSPFGDFATPTHGSTVRSSVPVTGWVLDDIGVTGVKIYNGNKYIGDAVLIEGARPDVEQAYPNYPMNYKAGWGYMMMTNFLPNGGNGTYYIRAKATDKEGHVVTLGSKTIYCDNAHAVKPFGAIDTPAQGGTASGDSFINWGWVLTPRPNYIPTNGSTINVYVDGVNIGHPTYNIYRKDIATLFPNYANSNGAIGYCTIDTTAYKNGVHTIQWIATDNAGNTDGIGSRYFTIQNTGSDGQRSSVNSQNRSLGNERLSSIPVDNLGPVIIEKGFNRDTIPLETYPDENSVINIEIREMERLEIDLGCPQWRGYHVIGDQLRPLPVGSTLDTGRGIFYWQPGSGFIGEYQLVFITREENGELTKRAIKINITPKYKK